MFRIRLIILFKVQQKKFRSEKLKEKAYDKSEVTVCEGI